MAQLPLCAPPRPGDHICMQARVQVCTGSERQCRGAGSCVQVDGCAGSRVHARMHPCQLWVCT